MKLPTHSSISLAVLAGISLVTPAFAVATTTDTFGSGGNSFTMDFVTVGNPGNTADTPGAPNPAGSVAYTYRMGSYEVSEDMANPFRNSNAKYFLPSENEWYKAAYYSSSGTYYNYATGSDTAPTAVASGTVGGTSVYGQTFATGPADIISAGGLSSYGTMAQGGNAWEWMESEFDGVNDSSGSSRGLRGGAWDGSASGPTRVQPLLPHTHGPGQRRGVPSRQCPRALSSPVDDAVS